MRGTSKASSAGSNSGRGASLGSSRRPGGLGVIAVLALVLLAAACLIPGLALAAETRLPTGSFGSAGPGSEFEVPGALAVDQGTHDVYVADYGLGTVEKFDQNGTPTNFSALGSNEIGGFSFFAGEALEELAVDSTSHALYVADYGNGVIKAFQQDGEPLEFTAGPGAGSNELPDVVELCGVAVDANGDIYMGDYSAGIHIFKPNGEEITSFPAFEPCNVAVDTKGAVYVSRYPFFTPGIDKFTPSEFPVTTSTTYPASGQAIDSNGTYALAIDPASDDLYADHSNTVTVYDSAGAPQYEFGGSLSASEGVAVDGNTEKAYAADAGNKVVQIFGPPIPLPSVTTEDAGAVTTITATLNGTVDPEGKQLTDCHFEYGTTSSYGSSAPCIPAAGSIPPDSISHAVSAAVGGLNPNTTYHFRLVAGTAEGTANGLDRTLTTAIGPPVISAQSVDAVGTADATLSAKVNPKGATTTYHVEYGPTAAYGQSTPESAPIGFSGNDSDHTVSVHIGDLSPATVYHFRFVATSAAGSAQGTDATFATYPSPPTIGSCPNDQFRPGFGARLSDCRAYEQATPIDKHGANVQGSVNIIQASGTGNRVAFYLNGGLPGSVGSSTLSPFMASRGPTGWSSAGLQPLTDPGYEANVVGWSDDLSTTVAKAPGPSNVGYALYLRDSDTGAFQLGPSSFAAFEADLAGFAADTSHLIFETQATLLSGAVGGKSNLYDLDHGSLSVVGRIPAGVATSCDDVGGPACEPAPNGSFAGPYNWFQSILNSGGAKSKSYLQDTNAISRDGSRVFFTAAGTGRLYLREDGTKTTEVSASQRTVPDPAGHKPAAFMAATPTGSQVIFSSPEELTDDATTGLPAAIGRANLDGSSPNLAFLPATARGIALDASHVYWADPAENRIGRANLDGSGANPNFITGASSPQAVAVDGSFVYWTNAANGTNGAGSIGRANLDGSGATQSFITGASNPQGIAVDSAHVYWANVGTTNATRSLGRANLDGSGATQSFTAAGTVVNFPSIPFFAGIAVDSAHIYWVSGVNNIARANLDGTGLNSNFITTNVPGGIAVDSAHIYWGRSGNPSNKQQIGRANLDGSGVDQEFIPAANTAPRGVAVDGSHIYWSGPDVRDSGNDLYSYDSGSGQLTDLTVDSDAGDSRGAEVQGVLGISDDGSYVYFAANGVLAPGGSPGSCVIGSFSSGPCNLYVSHEGTTTFIASLNDVEDWLPLAQPGGGSALKTSRVSADGSTLLFSSKQSLTGYGNTPTSPVCGGTQQAPSSCDELFRYSAPGEDLTCISCNPTGVQPSDDAALGTERTFVHESIHSTFLTRNLSADGKRVFFDSKDALLPNDTNGVNDVYEWEAEGSGSCESESQNGGCLYLLSSGTSPDPSYFADASTDGDHAFLFTSQQLVPGDRDELSDIYDAGVGGGLASQHTLAPPTCTGTACQANPAPPPDQPAASAFFSGPGNLHEGASARKCPKGKRQVRRAGKVRCQKAHRRHKRHNNRGGSK